MIKMDPLNKEEEKWCREYHAKNTPIFANDPHDVIGLTMRMTARLNYQRYCGGQNPEAHMHYMLHDPYYATLNLPSNVSKGE